MNNQIVTMLMNQLKAKNPQMYQMIEQARQGNADPMQLFKQVTNGYTPEDMNNLYSKAKQMGFPEDALQQIQNNMK